MNWEQAFNNLPYAMVMTFNPKKGEGWTESIIAVLLVLTFCLSIIMYNEANSMLVGLLGIIIGFYYGHQNTKYLKKK